MYDVCALGDAIVDMKPMAVSQGEGCLQPNPGGTIANMLSACSMLGLKCVIIGKVGDDVFGQYMAKHLEKYGVSTQGLHYDGYVRTTLSFVTLNEHGERSFSFYRNPGADTMLKPEELNTDLIRRSKIFHFSAMPLTDEPSRQTCMAAIGEAVKNNAIVSCDVNYRANLWRDRVTAKRVILRSLRHVDILKASEEDLTLLTDTNDVAKAVDRLYRQFKTPVIFATLGENGCYYKKGAATGHFSTYGVKAVDTTGAGDAFMGGMLYQTLSLGKPVKDWTDGDLRNIIHFANACGAFSVARLGSMSSMPCCGEVAQLMAETKIKKGSFT